MDTFLPGVIIGLICVAAVILGSVGMRVLFDRKHWIGFALATTVWLIGLTGVAVATLLITGA